MSLTWFPVGEGDTVVVLGAYIGKETKFFVDRVGVDGLVLAVEPMIENYYLIEEMIEDYSNIRLFRGCVSDVSGVSLIHVGTNSVNHSIVRDWGAGDRFTVCLSWGDLLERYSIGEVDLLYMDIEGAEELTLKGMTHTFPKYITLEHHEHIGVSKEPLFKLLSDKGYSYKEEGNRYIYAKR